MSIKSRKGSMTVRPKAEVVSSWSENRLLCGCGNYTLVSTVCDSDCLSICQIILNTLNGKIFFETKTRDEVTKDQTIALLKESNGMGWGGEGVWVRGARRARHWRML